MRQNLNIYKIPTNLHIFNLEKHEMNNYYSNIDYYLYTSRSEAFPLSFFELIFINKNILACKNTLPLDETFFNNSKLETIGKNVSFNYFDKVLSILQKQIDLQ